MISSPWIKRFCWDVRVPEVQQYIGRMCKVQDLKGRDVEKPVEIEEILGSLAEPTKFQINSKGNMYLVSMLDFFGQMNGERIDPADIKAFDETIFQVKRAPNWRPFAGAKKKLWTPPH